MAAAHPDVCRAAIPTQHDFTDGDLHQEMSGCVNEFSASFQMFQKALLYPV